MTRLRKMMLEESNLHRRGRAGSPAAPPRSLFSLVLSLIIPSAVENDLLYEFLRLRDTWPNQQIEIKDSSPRFCVAP